MNYPFEITVYAYRRPNLRDEGLEFEMYLGVDFLRTCFDKMEVNPEITDVKLSFPERWLNIIEQRSIFSRAFEVLSKPEKPHDQDALRVHHSMRSK